MARNFEADLKKMLESIGANDSEYNICAAEEPPIPPIVVANLGDGEARRLWNYMKNDPSPTDESMPGNSKKALKKRRHNKKS